MEGRTTPPHCPKCSAPGQGEVCPACGYRSGTAELRILPGARATTAVAIDVRLLREFKGPTVRDLTRASDAAVDRLPGQLRSMARALQTGDLAEADERLQVALGSIVPGPGTRRRRNWIPWTLLLWIWLASLVVAVLWLVL